MAGAALSRVAVIPHGDFAWDPSLLSNDTQRVRAEQIHAGCKALANSIRSASPPDAVILITPHGAALSHDFGISLGSAAAGFAAVGGDLHNSSVQPYAVPLSTPLLESLASDLSTYLTANGASVQGMLSFGDSEPAAIRWGEVIPLAFLGDLINGSTTPRLVLWSQPLRRYNDSIAMIPELLAVGALVGRFLEAWPGRALLLISSDLSHVHPDPGGAQPYGANETAANTFDAAVGAWASTGDARALERDAAAVAENALSCGWTGLLIAAGAMAGTGGSPAWVPQLIAGPVAPTYYGMLVALFEFKA